MLDRDLKPHLLEVNHNPSFQVLSEVDIAVKTQILNDTIKLINLDKSEILKSKNEDLKNIEEEIVELKEVSSEEKQEQIEKIDMYQQGCLGGFIQIFPSQILEKTEKFQSLMDSASEIQETYIKKTGGRYRILKESQQAFRVHLYRPHNTFGYKPIVKRQPPPQPAIRISSTPLGVPNSPYVPLGGPQYHLELPLILKSSKRLRKIKSVQNKEGRGGFNYFGIQPSFQKSKKYTENIFKTKERESRKMNELKQSMSMAIKKRRKSPAPLLQNFQSPYAQKKGTRGNRRIKLRPILS